MTKYIFILASAPETEDNNSRSSIEVPPASWEPVEKQDVYPPTTLLGFLRTKDERVTGGENRIFFLEPLAVERDVGRLRVWATGAGGFWVGGTRAGGFEDNIGLPPWGGSWAVTGNLEKNGFSWSMETESVLKHIWREKYLGERQTTK